MMLTILVLCAGLCGCNDEEDAYRDPFSDYEETFLTSTPTPMTENLSEAEPIFIMEGDSQWHLDKQVAETESFVYLVTLGWIVRVDKDTGHLTYFCNRAGCTHGEKNETADIAEIFSSCEALLYRGEESKARRLPQIQVYRGKLYIPTIYADGLYLDEYTEDGTCTEKKYFVTEDYGISRYNRIEIHRGNVYYAMMDGIFVRNLESGMSSRVYEFAEDEYLGEMLLFDESLYASVHSKEARLVAVDLTTGAAREIGRSKQDRSLSITLDRDGNVYYYSVGTGLCCYSVKSNETLVLWGKRLENLRSVRYDGRYLYMDNTEAVNLELEDMGEIRIFSVEGEELRVMQIKATVVNEKGQESVYCAYPVFHGGVGRWLFAEMTDDFFLMDKTKEGLMWQPPDVTIDYLSNEWKDW